MSAFVLLGMMIGVLLAHWELKSKRDFRRKFLNEYDNYGEKDSARRYVSGIIHGKINWKKSFSFVRKPFSREINLSVETAALVMAILGTISSLVNFDRHFSSMTQGAAVLVSLGLVISYIPIDWVLGGKVEKEMDAFVEELGKAVKDGELDRYIAQVRSTGTS